MAAHHPYTYNPPPQEQAYYDALFATADKSSTGYLSGSTAVEFLSLSKLPVDLLKTIWSMADQNPTNNTLDKKKFFVAVRLIQLFQNGKKPVDLELNLSNEDRQMPIRPPYFEGVNIVPQSQVQPSPQQSPTLRPMTSQPSPTMRPISSPTRPATAMSTMNGGMMAPLAIGTTTLAAQDPYYMTPPEQVRYDALFPTYASPEDNNYVHGTQAVELFLKSGMDKSQLGLIWKMCDDDPVDNKLDLVEFAIAMHLIVCVTKKGLPLPGELPPSLVRIRKESRMQKQQQQPQQSPTPVQHNMGASVVGGMSTMQPQQQLHQQQGMVQQHPSPGGIPSPEKMPGMGMYGAQSMAVGMTTMPSLEKQQPQMFQHQQPQMMMPGMVQQQPQQMGVANGYAGYGGGALGGETVDDAFAGLSNDPVADVDEYSAVGSAIGGTPHMSYPPPAAASLPVQSQIVSPLASPTFAPVQAPRQPVSSSPVHVQPVVTAASISAPKSPSPITGNVNAELEKLRAAHQKLQAEAISLRAKAGFVSDEGNETQAEITKVASEIATLSTTLGDLKTQVMEAKVKLADAVATLKALKEKKESLEKAVEESRETCDALNSATEAVVEANEEMIAHHARAVAAAAAAREAAEAPGADLFSWDAPAPAMQAMGTPWGGEQPAAAAASLPKLAPVADAGSVYSTNSAQHSVENTSAWGAGYGYGGDNMTPTNHYPPDGMMGMGASPMQQPKVAPTVNTAAQPVQQLPTIESPTAEQIDQLKRDALVAEKSFRSSKDLVKTLSKEVKNLEAAALKAEEEKKAIEAKKTKIGGKKTKKKEIEKAYEFAMGEQKKVEEAREQLEAAIRQADMAKSEAEKLRQQYEEAEVEAATAASYLSMNASHSVGPGIASQQQYQQQYQQPSPMYSDPFGMGSGGHIRTTSDSYGDGMGGGMGHGRTTSDPYAMGLMGGSANGDYANPFAI